MKSQKEHFGQPNTVARIDNWLLKLPYTPYCSPQLEEGDHDGKGGLKDQMHKWQLFNQEKKKIQREYGSCFQSCYIGEGLN